MVGAKIAAQHQNRTAKHSLFTKLAWYEAGAGRGRFIVVVDVSKIAHAAGVCQHVANRSTSHFVSLTHPPDPGRGRSN